MEMMKKLTITQRELVRTWAKLKAKLQAGEADQLIIPENGHRYIVTYHKPVRVPGDISGLLAKLKRRGPSKYKIKRVRIDWDMKYQRLMERLAKQRKSKSR